MERGKAGPVLLQTGVKLLSCSSLTQLGLYPLPPFQRAPF